jgi:hypothetical protein
MKILRTLIAAGTLAVAGLAASLPPAHAEFFGWQVSGVAANDVLNVRSSPATRARILVGYPNGTPLSLTGRCTGGLRLETINGRPAAEQVAAVRFRWCELWLDPLGDGNFRAGWVYGRFIRPR